MQGCPLNSEQYYQLASGLARLIDRYTLVLITCGCQVGLVELKLLNLDLVGSRVKLWNRSTKPSFTYFIKTLYLFPLLFQMKLKLFDKAPVSRVMPNKFLIYYRVLVQYSSRQKDLPPPEWKGLLTYTCTITDPATTPPGSSWIYIVRFLLYLLLLQTTVFPNCSVLSLSLSLYIYIQCYRYQQSSLRHRQSHRGDSKVSRMYKC